RGPPSDGTDQSNDVTVPGTPVPQVPVVAQGAMNPNDVTPILNSGPAMGADPMHGLITMTPDERVNLAQGFLQDEGNSSTLPTDAAGACGTTGCVTAARGSGATVSDGCVGGGGCGSLAATADGNALAKSDSVNGVANVESDVLSGPTGNDETTALATGTGTTTSAAWADANGVPGTEGSGTLSTVQTAADGPQTAQVNCAEGGPGAGGCGGDTQLGANATADCDGTGVGSCNSGLTNNTLGITEQGNCVGPVSCDEHLSLNQDRSGFNAVTCGAVATVCSNPTTGPGLSLGSMAVPDPNAQPYSLTNKAVLYNSFSNNNAFALADCGAGLNCDNSAQLGDIRVDGRGSDTSHSLGISQIGPGGAFASEQCGGVGNCSATYDDGKTLITNNKVQDYDNNWGAIVGQSASGQQLNLNMPQGATLPIDGKPNISGLAEAANTVGTAKTVSDLLPGYTQPSGANRVDSASLNAAASAVGAWGNIDATMAPTINGAQGAVDTARTTSAQLDTIDNQITALRASGDIAGANNLISTSYNPTVAAHNAAVDQIDNTLGGAWLGVEANNRLTDATTDATHQLASGSPADQQYLASNSSSATGTLSASGLNQALRTSAAEPAWAGSQSGLIPNLETNGQSGQDALAEVESRDATPYVATASNNDSWVTSNAVANAVNDKGGPDAPIGVLHEQVSGPDNTQLQQTLLSVAGQDGQSWLVGGGGPDEARTFAGMPDYLQYSNLPDALRTAPENIQVTGPANGDPNSIETTTQPMNEDSFQWAQRNVIDPVKPYAMEVGGGLLATGAVGSLVLGPEDAPIAAGGLAASRAMFTAGEAMLETTAAVQGVESLHDYASRQAHNDSTDLHDPAVLSDVANMAGAGLLTARSGLGVLSDAADAGSAPSAVTNTLDAGSTAAGYGAAGVYGGMTIQDGAKAFDSNLPADERQQAATSAIQNMLLMGASAGGRGAEPATRGSESVENEPGPSQPETAVQPWDYPAQSIPGDAITNHLDQLPNSEGIAEQRPIEAGQAATAVAQGAPDQQAQQPTPAFTFRQATTEPPGDALPAAPGPFGRATQWVKNGVAAASLAGGLLSAPAASVAHEETPAITRVMDAPKPPSSGLDVTGLDAPSNPRLGTVDRSGDLLGQHAGERSTAPGTPTAGSFLDGVATAAGSAPARLFDTSVPMSAPGYSPAQQLGQTPMHEPIGLSGQPVNQIPAMQPIQSTVPPNTQPTDQPVASPASQLITPSAAPSVGDVTPSTNREVWPRPVTSASGFSPLSSFSQPRFSRPGTTPAWQWALMTPTARFNTGLNAITAGATAGRTLQRQQSAAAQQTLLARQQALQQQLATTTNPGDKQPLAEELDKIGRTLDVLRRGDALNQAVQANTAQWQEALARPYPETPAQAAQRRSDISAAAQRAEELRRQREALELDRIALGDYAGNDQNNNGGGSVAMAPLGGENVDTTALRQALQAQPSGTEYTPQELQALADELTNDTSPNPPHLLNAALPLPNPIQQLTELLRGNTTLNDITSRIDPTQQPRAPPTNIVIHHLNQPINIQGSALPITAASYLDNNTLHTYLHPNDRTRGIVHEFVEAALGQTHELATQAERLLTSQTSPWHQYLTNHRLVELLTLYRDHPDVLDTVLRRYGESSAEAGQLQAQWNDELNAVASALRDDAAASALPTELNARARTTTATPAQPDVVVVTHDGGTVTIDPTARIANGTQLLALGGHIVVGPHASVRGTTVVARKQVEIANGAVIGPGTRIIDTTFPVGVDGQLGSGLGQPAAVRVGAGAQLGANVVVTGGVEIGDHAVVRPGAAVTRNVPANATAAPTNLAGRVIKTRPEPATLTFGQPPTMAEQLSRLVATLPSGRYLPMLVNAADLVRGQPNLDVRWPAFADDAVSTEIAPESNVSIGFNVRARHRSQILASGPNGQVTIGDNTWMRNSTIDAADAPVRIGQWGLIAQGSRFLAKHPLDVGHDVWTGSNVVVDATNGPISVGNGSIVGAGVVLTNSVPARSIVVAPDARATAIGNVDAGVAHGFGLTGRHQDARIETRGNAEVQTTPTTWLGPGTALLPEAGTVAVGEGTTLLGTAVLGHADVRIGPGSVVYPGVQIVTFNHQTNDPERPMAIQGITAVRPVTIGSGVVVYPNAVILGGVTIGDHAVIGPGALVLKDVPAGTVVHSPGADASFTEPAADQPRLRGSLRNGLIDLISAPQGLTVNGLVTAAGRAGRRISPSTAYRELRGLAAVGLATSSQTDRG
ncbi:MAG TPA: DapH/DapD/GlmU-related protein, partial [Pseudonocardiaceae bacterium]|nr:DapH/DapD/GlmU-related protein [Pseudonocardiaceae bacterium]